MTRLFKIPRIKWGTVHGGDGFYYCSYNTAIEYIVRQIDGKWYCYYGSGRNKEFNSAHEAKVWVETTHYPAQVAKYLMVVEGVVGDE